MNIKDYRIISEKNVFQTDSGTFDNALARYHSDSRGLLGGYNIGGRSGRYGCDRCVF